MKNLIPALFFLPIYGVLFLIGYWWFLDERLFPADVVTGKAWVEPLIVHSGDTITVNYTLDTRRGCPRIFKSWLTNGIVTVFEDHYGHQPEPAGQRVLSYNIKLPINMRPGMHIYHVRGTWICNPVKSQVIHYPDITFEVR